jgi:transcriptional regulator with XRE-family HTH domain
VDPLDSRSCAAIQMEEPGQKLRRAREALHLKYRDVEEASQRIAKLRENDEFLVGLSRLADIENKGTVPSLYRLYSLCAIYRLEFSAVLRWYGIDVGELAADSARLPLDRTHRISFECPDGAKVQFPVEFDEPVDLRQTSYLSRHIHKWGKLPIILLNALDLRKQRYAFVGTEDWSMYPIVAPGSFIQIDEAKRRVAAEGWSNEFERPIYFLEHRHGYRCGWCADRDGLLIVQGHASSRVAPEIFRYPGEADVIGQVVGVAMRLDQGKRRHTRS